ncbi:hypothetical protein AGDE_16961 [Angomonas deanei]|uniref:Uncharacterized protein n=1 Tax=Angomonas deanei TaxID=59799 RepID=A0A7G2CML5_9TRYP|nr:hypothetical protein AGDE_16961 [Angomonas deanei]CAD2220184.1 hypothetical protein, conserved [Angomonas deanei]|eukprot:EPY15807.1 hypothetical protein AGDE_16961 [Angomonas deanei]
MEACAVVYGCDTNDAKEVYFQRFLQLDLDSLERDGEALRERQEMAEEVQRRLHTSDAPPQEDRLVDLKDTVDRLPSLFDDEEESVVASDDPDASAEKDTDIDITEAYAPLYLSFLEHVSGARPVVDVLRQFEHFDATDRLHERRRWRAVMEKLISESYHQLTADDIRDAIVLNHQLHSVKFFDLKLGDTVREIVQVLQRDVNAGSGNRDTPAEVSPAHPERRV